VDGDGGVVVGVDSAAVEGFALVVLVGFEDAEAEVVGLPVFHGAA